MYGKELDYSLALASVRYYDDDFRVRHIYTVGDNYKDESRVFDGLKALVHAE